MCWLCVARRATSDSITAERVATSRRRPRNPLVSLNFDYRVACAVRQCSQMGPRALRGTDLSIPFPILHALVRKKAPFAHHHPSALLLHVQRSSVPSSRFPLERKRFPSKKERKNNLETTDPRHKSQTSCMLTAPLVPLGPK